MLMLRREAENDVKAAYEWYEKQQFDLGREFVSEIESILESIEDNPDLYHEVHKNVRRALCKRFPYSVYFVKSGSDIVVLGVFHQRRHPAAWEMRR